MNGQTGLDCFDSWASELIETGYLHNNARMWFASIWIFTLGWRWVAGLHTRGKPYPADAQNIATFTAGRFAPRASDLAKVTQR
jgi:deoxyribodipyrimidine photo-lyase